MVCNFKLSNCPANFFWEYSTVIYRDAIHDFITHLEPEECHAWFQQDNAPTHKLQ